LYKPLQITFKGTESSPALEALIRQRVDALERLHRRITGCRVVVEIPHRGADSVKVPMGVAVEVDVPGHTTIFAKDIQERHEAKADHTAPLNNAFDAVERQLEKISEMQIHNVKSAEAAPQSGMVVRLFAEQGYGLVEVDNSPELYFTRNAVTGGDFDELEEGMVVQVTRATPNHHADSPQQGIIICCSPRGVFQHHRPISETSVPWPAVGRLHNAFIPAD
jgi:ribosome-associated translation inhibitor RaiA/cold shock CspA family protein